MHSICFLDPKLQECTLEANSAVYGIASVSVPLSKTLFQKFLQNPSHFYTAKRTWAVFPTLPFKLSYLWITWIRLNTSRTEFWTPLSQSRMSLNIAESTSPSFFKLIIDVVVMVIRHLETTKTTPHHSGLVIPSKRLIQKFVMSVLTSMYDPRAPSLATAED